MGVAQGVPRDPTGQPLRSRLEQLAELKEYTVDELVREWARLNALGRAVRRWRWATTAAAPPGGRAPPAVGVLELREPWDSLMGRGGGRIPSGALARGSSGGEGGGGAMQRHGAAGRGAGLGAASKRGGGRGQVLRPAAAATHDVQQFWE
jgi:hypothetical protein